MTGRRVTAPAAARFNANIAWSRDGAADGDYLHAWAAVVLGLGRIVALYYRSSTVYKIR
jgi:hypothetical protein